SEIREGRLSCTKSPVIAALPSLVSPPDWKAVDDAMGWAGQDQPDGTHKYSIPRRDLKVTNWYGGQPGNQSSGGEWYRHNSVGTAICARNSRGFSSCTSGRMM